MITNNSSTISADYSYVFVLVSNIWNVEFLCWALLSVLLFPIEAASIYSVKCIKFELFSNVGCLQQACVTSNLAFAKPIRTRTNDIVNFGCKFPSICI